MGRVWPIVLVVLVALTAAGGWLRFDAAAQPSFYQSADERSYAMIARALAVNGRYGDPGQDDPVHWPPGAPLLFAAAYELHPETRGDGVWDVPAAYPVQAAVGTLTIPAAFALATVVAGPFAGLLAATGVAFYPPLISASGDLLSEPLGALLATLGLLALAVGLRRPGWWWFAASGVLLGATILTRADLILVPAIALAATLVVMWRRRGAGRALSSSVALAAGCALLVTPWTLYASGQAGRFVPISTGGASNLWVGTYLPGDGTMFGAKRAMAAEVVERYPTLADNSAFQIPAGLVIETVAARRPTLGPEAALRAEAIDNLGVHALGRPGAFAGMMVDKVGRLWLHYTTGTHRNPREWITVIHLVIVGLGALGLVAGLVRTRRAELWLLAAVLLYVTALNAVMVSEPRHNLAVMPLVAVAGAAGLALALRGLGGRVWSVVQRAGGVRLIRAIRPGSTLASRS